MARTLDDELYEQQTKQEVGPIRWMAPEQMHRRVYSKASDVFAFGVVLYEIWARRLPWTGVDNLKVVIRVTNGERLKAPRAMPQSVRDIMAACCTARRRKRPTMVDVVSLLNEK